MGPINRPHRFSKTMHITVFFNKVGERKTGDSKLRRMNDKICGTSGKKANGADL